MYLLQVYFEKDRFGIVTNILDNCKAIEPARCDMIIKFYNIFSWFWKDFIDVWNA